MDLITAKLAGDTITTLGWMPYTWSSVTHAVTELVAVYGDVSGIEIYHGTVLVAVCL